MALGALITNEPHEVLEMELSKVKARYHLSSEVKWTKMPTQGKFLDGYKALVESFVTLPIRYKVFIIDTVKHPLAHDVYSKNNDELGFYKYFYQLLYIGIMKRDPRPNYHIYLDPKSKMDEGSVATLERCINGRAVVDEFPDMWNSSCCIIEELHRPSACLQLTDLLTGMIAAKWNRTIKAPKKLEFISWAETILSLDFSKKSKPYGNHKCDIWPFKMTTW